MHPNTHTRFKIYAVKPCINRTLQNKKGDKPLFVKGLTFSLSGAGDDRASGKGPVDLLSEGAGLPRCLSTTGGETNKATRR